MADRESSGPVETVRVTASYLEPMVPDRDLAKLYGMSVWLYDEARLGPITAATAIALATEVFLIGLGVGLGAATAPPGLRGLPIGLATALIVWTVVSTWLSLWLGGWHVAHMAGVSDLHDAILNGVGVWGLYVATGVTVAGLATFLGVGSLASVTVGGGALDLLRAINLSALFTVTPEQAQAILSAVRSAATAVWVGTAVGAGFAVLGSWLGARSRRVHVLPPGAGEQTGTL